MSDLRRGAILLVTALVAGLLVSVSTVPLPAAAVPQHRILITGDSITHGASGDYTWRYRLWNKLESVSPGTSELVGTRTDLYDTVNNVNGSQHYAAAFAAKAHAAQWGGSFVQSLNEISSQVSSTNANVLVVALGSNDLAFHTSPQQTIDNLASYVSKARTARPGIDVVVSEVVNRWDPWAQTYQFTAETDQYAALLQTFG